MLRRYSNLRNLACARSHALGLQLNRNARWCSSQADAPVQSNMTPASQKKPAVALPPTKRLAIVTCMDARINPFTQLGIKDGEAHIIRNAGAVAKDALRSLIISQRLLGTREIAIYHHTGCGIVTFTTPELRKAIKDADPGNEATASSVEEVDFMTYPPDLEQSVRNDVKFLQENPLILKGTKVTGWIWDVDTRQATQVI